jgi:hypothetical protein
MIPLGITAAIVIVVASALRFAGGTVLNVMYETRRRDPVPATKRTK